VQKTNEEYIQKYLEDIQRRFVQDRDKALREWNEDTLTKDVQELFGNAKLLSVSGYDSESNQKIMSTGVGELSHIKPMTILKSYTLSVLKTFYHDRMKDVILDAFYQDKEWGTQLGNLYYLVEALPDRIESFEKALFGEGRISLENLDKNSKNKNNLTAGIKILEHLNKAANDLLEKETQNIARFASLTVIILKDFKSPKPEYITNIRGLGGHRNREIIQGLADGYNKTLQFLKIMKSFIVMKGVSTTDSSP